MAAPQRAAISQLSPGAPPTAAARALPHTLALHVDNDAFDFWMPPWDRPDEEYTSGVHITWDGGDAPRWARWLSGARPGCAYGERRCRTARLELGQDIYTPPVSADNPHAPPGSRPNAGWLYLAQAARALDAQAATELTATVGVTGPPSLARFTQHVAHQFAPAYNRPTDWSEQIGFEPGVIARLEHRRLLSAADGASYGVDLIPRASISAGNVITAAEAGVQARAGWHMPHPWLLETPRPSLTFDAGIYGRAVARNLFLDGSTFGDGPRVGHKPYFAGADGGVEARFGRVYLAYRATSEMRSWARGPKWHPWASMIGGITFDR